MAKVSWTVGNTINTGNFENIKLECSVEDDVRQGESIKQAEERVFNFVLKRVQEKGAQIRDELEGEDGGY